MDSARSMLYHARLPKNFWGPAMLTASHIYNVCPHPNDAGVFGCDAYALVDPSQRTKLDARAKKYIFLGYADHQKGYNFYDPDTGRITVHRSVRFNEQSFGNRGLESALADPMEPLATR